MTKPGLKRLHGEVVRVWSSRSRQYERRAVLDQLAHRGVQISYHEQQPTKLTIPRQVTLGIKLWGMIDFLGLPWRWQGAPTHE
jgi:phosphopantothenoylcysteine synthetase/decarboxylase